MINMLRENVWFSWDDLWVLVVLISLIKSKNSLMIMNSLLSVICYGLLEVIGKLNMIFWKIFGLVLFVKMIML